MTSGKGLSRDEVGRLLSLATSFDEVHDRLHEKLGKYDKENDADPLLLAVLYTLCIDVGAVAGAIERLPEKMR